MPIGRQSLEKFLFFMAFALCSATVAIFNPDLASLGSVLYLRLVSIWVNDASLGHFRMVGKPKSFLILMFETVREGR